MPVEQRLWLHEESSPTTFREKATQPSEQCPITWLHERTGNLPAQHSHLVAKHHDLDGEIVALQATESEHLEDTDQRCVEERQGHLEVSLLEGHR
jgi:hypothetical protein